MLTNNFHNFQKRGVILVVTVLVLMVATLAAVVSLNSSRQNIAASVRSRSKMIAKNTAQEAINRALAKMRNTPNWVVLDAVGVPARLWSPVNPVITEINALTNCEALYTWTSADHNAQSPVAPDLVSDNGKLICNFLGSSLSNGYVSVVRHKKFADINTSFPAIPYLISAVVKNDDGSKQRHQAVALFPITVINGDDLVADPNAKPFITAEMTF